jgi:hypothetical protein
MAHRRDVREGSLSNAPPHTCPGVFLVRRRQAQCKVGDLLDESRVWFGASSDHVVNVRKRSDKFGLV